MASRVPIKKYRDVARRVPTKKLLCMVHYLLLLHVGIVFDNCRLFETYVNAFGYRNDYCSFVHRFNNAVYSADGYNAVAFLELVAKLLEFFLAFLLGTYHKEIEYGNHCHYHDYE